MSQPIDLAPPRSLLDQLIAAGQEAWGSRTRGPAPNPFGEAEFRSSPPGEACVSLRWRDAESNGGIPKCELCGATAQSSGANCMPTIFNQHCGTGRAGSIQPTSKSGACTLQHRKNPIARLARFS